MDPVFDRARVERVARIYRSNSDAARALGIRPSSFGRLCKRLGIESPYERRQRLLAAAGHLARKAG